MEICPRCIPYHHYSSSTDRDEHLYNELGGRSTAHDQRTMFEEVQAYVKLNNITTTLNNINSETCFIAFDIDTLAIRFSAGCVGFFLVSCEVVNVGSCYLVQKKIMEAKGSMSRETLRMHRSLTWVLLAQVSPKLCLYVFLYFYLLSCHSVSLSP